MTDDPKKHRATILHRCDQHVAALKHKPEGGAELIVAHPVANGEPTLPGEKLYQLDRGEDGPTIELIHDGGAGAKSGPARVSNAAFRKGYDTIFGKPKRDRTLN